MLVQQEYHRAIYSPSPKLRLSARSKLNPAARPAYLHTIRRKPLPTRNSISLFSMEGKRTIFCREGNIITSSLEGQERRMNGHPWPTATPHCKTLSSYWAHAHEFTCAPITLRRHHTHTHDWSIYRLSVDETSGHTARHTAAPVNRRPCGHLLPSTPGGWLPGLVPLCLGNACRRQTTLKGEGEDVSRSGISLEEEFEEDSGVRFLFSSLDGGQ